MTLKIIIGLGLLVFLYLYFRDTNTEPRKINNNLYLFLAINLLGKWLCL